MAKRKAKKTKNTIDSATQDKIDKLIKLRNDFKMQAVEYENYLNRICTASCHKIEKLYQDHLKAIPENIRNMTIAEYVANQEKQGARLTECPRDEMLLRSQFERQKMTTEKKRTQRKERKRSISAPASARNLLAAKQLIMNTAPKMSRNASELSLLTPSHKQKKPSLAVTPKFNPKFPVLKARKPNPGEVFMSLSGSPLHNYMDDLPSDKPAAKVTLSFGQGKVITFGENDEIDIGKELLKSIDEPLKATIQNVQKKLEEILKG